MFGFQKKLVVPSPEWVAKANQKIMYTPDMPREQRYEARLLFVYDETMAGHFKEELKGDNIKLAQAFTADQFSVWKQNLGDFSYPIAINTQFKTDHETDLLQKGSLWVDNIAPRASIKGELYLIRPKQLEVLDKYKGNGLEFKRERVTVHVPYKWQLWSYTQGIGGILEERTYVREITAWMYIGLPDYWNDLIDGGYMFTPVKTYTPKSPELLKVLPKYYYFARTEYNGKQVSSK